MDQYREEGEEDRTNMGLAELDSGNTDENLSSSDTSESMNGEHAIGLVQAQAIAEQKFPGKQIVKFGHKTENGQRVYSFHFSDKSHVNVNFTGEVTYSKNKQSDN